jgi:hypothetical protein
LWKKLHILEESVPQEFAVPIQRGPRSKERRPILSGFHLCVPRIAGVYINLSLRGGFQPDSPRCSFTERFSVQGTEGTGLRAVIHDTHVKYVPEPNQGLLTLEGTKS